MARHTSHQELPSDMNLSPELKEQLIGWVREGQSLSQLQRALEEAGTKLTYMEVRFLLDDLAIDLPKATEPQEEEGDTAKPPVQDTVEADLEPAGGAVTVEVDRLTRPGAIASGSVVFSDGTKATWALDQMGRLALDAGSPDYRPPSEDIAEFQSQLRSALEGM